MAYASCGQLLFGGYDEQFGNGFTSILTMLRCTVGDIRSKEATESKEIAICIYYLSFIILVYMILLLSFRAIIMNNFSKIKKLFESSQSRLYDTLHLYMRDLFDWISWRMWSKRKVRPYLDIDIRGEPADDLLLQEATDAATRYKIK